MTLIRLKNSLKELYDKYRVARYYPFALRGKNHNKLVAIMAMLDKLDILMDKAGMRGKLPRKIKLDVSIKRKCIVSIFSEVGLKVIRYTREYGRTIVYFEPISDSQ